jgi:hypothetical protein
MIRYISALSCALALAGTGHAVAATKCDVVGFWSGTVLGQTEDFQMKTNKTGTSPDQNPECNNETSKVTTTKLGAKPWNFKITAKKCSVVITVQSTFNKGVCDAASGTITIPGAGSFPITLTESTGGVKRTPSRASTSLMSGLR